MTTANGKLSVRLLRLTNIGGVQGALEVPLGDITYLEGTNGVGKSSVVDGLAALCGRPVQDLLNQGADEGEIYLELSDSTWFRRRLTADGKNVLTAGHPEQGTIGKAASWLKATLSAAALSPTEFLEADDAKAAEYILRTAPLTVTEGEIREALGEEIGLPKPIDVSAHALTVLDRAIKALYDERTGENRAAKDARTTAEQLQRSIPEDAADPDELGARAEALRATLAGILQARDSAEKVAAHEARAESDADFQDVSDKLTARVAKSHELRAELRRIQDAILAEEQAIVELHDRQHAITAERDVRAEAAAKAAGAEFQERQAAVSAELAQVRQAHETAVKAASAIQNTRNMIERQEQVARAAHDRSHALTKAMARLDALKAAKAAELPIEGVSIQDGRLHIDGVPAHRANTARRVQVAIDASTAQKARVQFVFADDLEHLATKTRKAVERACRERGIQILAARVTDDEEMQVRIAEPEVAHA